jgi:hypothetical protein
MVGMKKYLVLVIVLLQSLADVYYQGSMFGSVAHKYPRKVIFAGNLSSMLCLAGWNDGLTRNTVP